MTGHDYVFNHARKEIQSHFPDLTIPWISRSETKNSEFVHVVNLKKEEIVHFYYFILSTYGTEGYRITSPGLVYAVASTDKRKSNAIPERRFQISLYTKDHILKEKMREDLKDYQIIVEI